MDHVWWSSETRNGRMYPFPLYIASTSIRGASFHLRPLGRLPWPDFFIIAERERVISGWVSEIKEQGVMGVRKFTDQWDRLIWGDQNVMWDHCPWQLLCRASHSERLSYEILLFISFFQISDTGMNKSQPAFKYVQLQASCKCDTPPHKGLCRIVLNHWGDRLTENGYRLKWTLRMIQHKQNYDKSPAPLICEAMLTWPLKILRNSQKETLFRAWLQLWSDIEQSLSSRLLSV